MTKSARVLGYVVWLAPLLAGSIACSAPPPEPRSAPDQAAPTPVQAQAQAKPQPGGTLVYTISRTEATLHPLKGNRSDILRHVGLAYETLIAFDYRQDRDFRIDYNAVPWLAESWEQPDAKTYVFRLRRGVKWHDGVEFTAADVAATFDWVIEERFSPADILRQIQTVEQPDPYTLKVTLREPSLGFLAGLADQNTLIAPKHAIDAKFDFSKSAVGTGAFKLQSYQPNNDSRWVKHADYWQSGRPYPDGARQFYNLDQAASTAAFVAGKADLLASADKAELDGVLKQRPDARFLGQIAGYTLPLYLRVDRPPFNDVRVRRAMHLAVDRQALLKTATFGEGSIDPPFVPGWRTGLALPQEELLAMPGYRQPKDQDRAEAKRLLAEAGYANGLSFKLEYNSQGIAPPRIAVGVEPSLKAVGLNVELEPLETGLSNKREREGDFDAAAFVTVSDNFARLYEYNHSKGSMNSAHIADPKLDQLIDAFNAALTEAERRRTAQEMQRYMLDQVYSIPTVNLAAFGLWQPWVKDYILSHGPVVRPIQATVSRLWLDPALLPKDR